MSILITLTAQPQASGAAYRVAYDGLTMGDDRGYASKAECEAAINSRIASDVRDAARFERPLMYRKS
jgi:uncharacterized protein YegP (UPF0339 family)